MTLTEKLKAKENRIKRRGALLEGLSTGLLFGIYIGLAIGLNLSPTHTQAIPAQPYLNTSHFPVFTPYTQNTNLWLTIKGSIYQYWATLDNYAAGQTPCVLTMSTVKNGTITYTLNKTEAIATLANVQIVDASGNSPNQTDFTDITAYFGGLSVCQNYNITK
jgi:hypothetical protein